MLTVNFSTKTTTDLKKRTTTLEIGKVRIEEKLPVTLTEIKNIGFYTKDTSSDFSPIKIDRE